LTKIDLSGCKKLLIIDCKENKLKELLFAENSKLELKEFWGSNNKFKNIEKILSCLKPKKLTYFNVSNNNISANINIFRAFTKLESLYIDDNKLIRGSLDELKELNELFNIDISNTSVEIGKLNENNEILKRLEEIYCSDEILKGAELKRYYNKEDGFYDVKAHRENRTRDFKVDKIIRTPFLSEKKSNYSIKNNFIDDYYGEK